MAEGNALLIKPTLQALSDHADLSIRVFDNAPNASAKNEFIIIIFKFHPINALHLQLNCQANNNYKIYVGK